MKNPKVLPKRSKILLLCRLKNNVKKSLQMVCNQSLETPITDTATLQLLVDKLKQLMRDLLFPSTNMAAMTSRENHLF